MTIPEHLANRDIDPSAVVEASGLPDRARVVIVGGGIIGSSIAYHLTREGETDVVLLERGKLSNGTTWHAAGLVSQVRGTHALTALSRINAETYERLPAETGVETGMRRIGALTVARTEGRMQEILYGVAMAKDAGVDVEVLEAAAVKDLWPAAVVDDLVGAVLFPTDGTVNPGDATMAFAKGAVDRGARYVPETEVTGFLFGERGRVTGLDTSRGAIDAETIVLACGLWTSELARSAGASVALYPAEHVWVMTEEAQGAREDSPFLRDLDAYLYIRHYRGRYVIGAFEPNGKPMRPGAVPTAGFAEFGPDWDHFAPVLAGRTRARARDRDDRFLALPARARELHARLELPARVRAGGAGALRRCGLQLAGDHLRPGCREGRRRVDRGRPPHDGPGRGRRCAHREVGEPEGVAARAHGRVARRPVRDALAPEAAEDRPRGSSGAVVRSLQ